MIFFLQDTRALTPFFRERKREEKSKDWYTVLVQINILIRRCHPTTIDTTPVDFENYSDGKTILLTSFPRDNTSVTHLLGLIKKETIKRVVKRFFHVGKYTLTRYRVLRLQYYFGLCHTPHWDIFFRTCTPKRLRHILFCV